MAKLSPLMVLALTACASKSAGPAGPPATAASPPAAPAAAAPVADPKEVVRAFFAAIAQLDVARAAEFASFPFDVDGYDGCVQSKKELVDLIATYKPPPPGTPIEIGDVGLIPLDGSAMKPPSWPEDHWRSHLKHFTAADAKCLGPADAAQIYSYYFVEFTVGGEAVGAIIRLRCRGASCGVAGTDK